MAASVRALAPRPAPARPNRAIPTSTARVRQTPRPRCRNGRTTGSLDRRGGASRRRKPRPAFLAARRAREDADAHFAAANGAAQFVAYHMARVAVGEAVV